MEKYEFNPVTLRTEYVKKVSFKDTDNKRVNVALSSNTNCVYVECNNTKIHLSEAQVLGLIEILKKSIQLPRSLPTEKYLFKKAKTINEECESNIELQTDDESSDSDSDCD